MRPAAQQFHRPFPKASILLTDESLSTVLLDTIRDLLALFRLANCESVRDIVVRVPHGIQWDEHPQHVEEDEVYPHIHEVAAIEVDITSEPLRAKGHEPYA